MSSINKRIENKLFTYFKDYIEQFMADCLKI